MKFDELYSKIQNPIDNDENMLQIINAYSKMILETERMLYTNLVTTVPRSEDDKINEKDKENFHVLLFNKIKNSIKNLTKEKYIELTKNGHGDSLLKIRKNLLTVEDAKAIEDANKILGNLSDVVPEKTVRYYFDGAYAHRSWEHISLHRTSGKFEKYDKVEHRLYLNVARQDMYKLASILVEKMYEYDFPFYFKFDPKSSRDDSLVIYSSSEHFLDNLQILKEIEQEYPEIISRCGNPTILSGHINDWIGYGSEPFAKTEEEKNSFNNKRTPILFESITQEWKKWIAENKKVKVRVNNAEITFEEMIANFCAEKFFKSMKDKYEKFRGTDEEFQKMFGYGKKEVESTRVLQIIKGIFKTQIHKLIDDYVNNRTTEKIVINTKNNKLTYDYLYFRKDIRELLQHVAKLSPDLVEKIRKSIKSKAQENGIEPNNFCFDTYAKKSLRDFLEKLEKAKTPPLIVPNRNKKIKEKPKTSFAKPENEKQAIEETIIKEKEQKYKKDMPVFANPKKEKDSIIEKLQQAAKAKNEKVYTDKDLENTDLNMLLKLINPTLLEKDLKLPNGTTMSARKYIELIVFPHLPQDGVIILDNDATIPVIQFIEEGVLGECQEKYNGNFPLYLYERTKQNKGVLKLKNKGVEYDLSTDEIPDYVNQTLLIRPMILPNRKMISTPEYIREYYSKHIPYNGIVTLANGNKVSAPRYIEEILLYTVESKYNGNLPLALFETTRKNNGTIDISKKNYQLNSTKMDQVEEIKSKKM